MSSVLPVLIVGGGPVGLTASLLLSDLGVDSLLVERNPSTTDHPKAHVVNTRTMEIFRALGIEAAVRSAALPIAGFGHIRWVRSLAGAEVGRLDTAMKRGDVSPTGLVSCAQDRVESFLLEAAGKRRGRIRFGTELVSLEQDRSGVTARLGDETIRARYVIAADGASSGVRRQLGIAMSGLPEVATLVGTYFHADLRHLFEARPAVLYWVMNTAAPGTFIALDGAMRWVFHLGQPGAGVELGAEEAERLIKLAIGEPGVAVDVRSIRPWRMTAQIAERYREGRVFLVGDAAHRFPPTGGLGLNTGVQDVHNLAWKLALVLSRAAPESLLETYETERRPVAEANSNFSLGNFLHGGTAIGPGALATMVALEGGGPDVPAVLAQLHADIEAGREHFGSQSMDLGFVYAAGAIVPEDDAPPVVVDPSADYVPDARPGARVPHVWLEHDGARVSTHDLVGKDFVLLCAGAAEPWLSGVTASGITLTGITLTGITLTHATVDPGPPFGLEPGGALLVRPDGHVAWRSVSPPGDPAKTLDAVIRQVIDPAV